MSERTNGGLVRRVFLSWQRAAQPASGEGSPDVEQAFVDDAIWKTAGGVHYLSYLEPGSEQRGTGGSEPDTRTTLRFADGPGASSPLVVIRQGTVRWKQSFLAGESSQTTLYAGGFAIPVEIETNSVLVSVAETNGFILIDYFIDAAGDKQRVKLSIRFDQEVFDDGQAYPTGPV
ncbi:DUF1934 domain-containing protein [Alicyclobacillus tolerans]|uniref:DUF1934 domain-containing protein n=1 Tax=Alicyclobacillus tolerans TaxID=90970 RepID=UPI001F25016D|nr:DUF1934 domain-containing protein [Alicyclobacillus tolerans]MCF8565637.1 DUF1934 domain-containing protein [Alicyclobacillus tolerans]